MITLQSIGVECLSNRPVPWLDITTLLLGFSTIYLSYEAIKTAKKIQKQQFLFELKKNSIITSDPIINGYLRDKENKKLKSYTKKTLKTSINKIKKIGLNPYELYDKDLHDLINEIELENLP